MTSTFTFHCPTIVGCGSNTTADRSERLKINKMLKPLQHGGNKYTSARAVPPTASSNRGQSSAVSIFKALRIFLAVAAFVLLCTTITLMNHFHTVDSNLKDHINNAPAIHSILADNNNEKQPPNVQNKIEMGHGVHANVQNHIQGLRDHIIKEAESRSREKIKQAESESKKIGSDEIQQSEPKTQVKVKSEGNSSSGEIKQSTSKVLKIHSSTKTSLARGYSGLPMEKTPALVGAKRGSIQCDIDVDISSLAYWNSPQGSRDEAFVSPFNVPSSIEGKRKYLTFEADTGGWNNIRFVETQFMFAFAQTCCC